MNLQAQRMRTMRNLWRTVRGAVRRLSGEWTAVRPTVLTWRAVVVTVIGWGVRGPSRNYGSPVASVGR
jgi:hypothetical protein